MRRQVAARTAEKLSSCRQNSLDFVREQSVSVALIWRDMRAEALDNTINFPDRVPAAVWIAKRRRLAPTPAVSMKP